MTVTAGLDMTMLLSVLALTGSFHTPAQLNVPSFTGCLAHANSAMPVWPNLTATRQAFGLNHVDGLLIYLALYSNHRSSHALLNATEEWAYKRWAVAFWPMGQDLALWLRERAGNYTTKSSYITPGELYGAASQSCQRHLPALSREEAPYCAAIVSHNVLRTLGRPVTYISATADYLPPWYEADTASWLHATPRIAARMISLRRDGGGERWGDWYHAFGVIAFGIHEAAIEGERLSALVTFLVASANSLLNPILASGCEDPVKSQGDRDAARVAISFARGGALGSSKEEALLEGADDHADAPQPLTHESWVAACATPGGYVLQVF